MDLYGKTDKSILLDIGLKVKERRLEMNISQKELSSRAGVSVRTISEIEKGSNYTFLSLIALLRALFLLDYLEMFLEEKTISPIEYAKLLNSSNKRERATASRDKQDEEELVW